ncbi:MAG: hypothetical protein A2284_06245 [Deltaproteobacteria bacterium RIFOXYA12_FULL_61_11]|nr:MAG: hypothetical protein A2284_06245 [Deltaproteobacteria bacterium RIFOXYA12_FULL_61_11]
MFLRNRSLYALRSSIFGMFVLAFFISELYLTPFSMVLSPLRFESREQMLDYFSYHYVPEDRAGGSDSFVYKPTPKVKVDIQIEPVVWFQEDGVAPWGLLFLVLLVWGWPILGFTRHEQDQLTRRSAQRRVEGFLSFVVVFFLLKFLLMLAAHFVTYHQVLLLDRFLGQRLPALLLSTVIQISVAMVVLNNFLLRRHDVLETLFSGEDLYKPKRLLTLPLWLRVVGLLAANTVLPMAVVIVLLLRYHDIPERYVDTVIVETLGLSLGITLLGLFSILYGFKRPIAELLNKMKRLAEGDFEVRTSVLLGDEIGRLKLGFNRMVEELREREQLRDLFGKFVSVEIAKKLLATREVNLGGDTIEAAVLFSDIRNFTPMSERMSAEEVVVLLNRYFSFVVEPIVARRGVVNKFIGDAVMAVFSPLFGSKQYAEDAFQAGKGILARLDEFNRLYPQYGIVHCGVGIHCGTLVAGNIGTEQRLEFTVIGDTVNTASRLESLTKTLGWPMLVSGPLIERLPLPLRSETHFLEQALVKGKSEAIAVHALTTLPTAR